MSLTPRPAAGLYAQKYQKKALSAPDVRFTCPLTVPDITRFVQAKNAIIKDPDRQKTVVF